MSVDSAAGANLDNLPDELAGLEVLTGEVGPLNSFEGLMASDDGLLNTDGELLSLLGEGELLAFCCSVCKSTLSRAFSTSRFLSCSVVLMETDLCLTFSTSRSRELVRS